MIYDVFAVFFGVFVTIFIYSFLWKENPLSRAVEHLFVGMAAVYTLAAMYDAAMTQAVWGAQRIEGGNYIWIIPILISFMYFFFFTKKYFYLYRYPVSIVVGIMAGMMICGMIQSNFLAQIQSTAVDLPLVGAGTWDWSGGSTGIVGLNSLLIIIGLITALTFFFFTFEHKGVLGISTKLGRYFLMATFGAAYGSTVMARTSLFIGRLRFLYETTQVEDTYSVSAWWLLPIAIICVIIVALWMRSRPEKAPEPVPAPAPKPEKPKSKG
jgi:hypothetical protein